MSDTRREAVVTATDLVTPPGSPKKTTPTGSPAKPVLVDLNIQGLELFFFPSKTGKKEGLSPSGKSRIPLSKYEGKHHMKAKDETGQVLGGSPVKSPRKRDLKHCEQKLSLMLVNLKERADMDYRFHVNTSDIDFGHYEATRIDIKKSIALFKRCYSLSVDKDGFIDKYNQFIEAGAFYNPFRLRGFYKDETYDEADYKKACEEIDFKDGLKDEDFGVLRQPVQEPEKITSQKRKREEEDLLAVASAVPSKLFVPRNLKVRRVLNTSPHPVKESSQSTQESSELKDSSEIQDQTEIKEKSRRQLTF